MNDDELRRRLLDSVGQGGDEFWASVDRSLEDVESTDGFVTALPADDPHQQLASVTPIGRSVRSFRAVLAAAAVLVIGAGGLAASLLDRSADSVTTNDPATESASDESDDSDETDQQDEPSLSVPLDSLPTGTEVCFASVGDQAQSIARMELLDGLAVSGYMSTPASGVRIAIVDRFVGRRMPDDGVASMAVTRFDQVEQSRRNVDWTITEATLTTDAVTLDRTECDQLPATYSIGTSPGVEIDEQQIQALAAGAENAERSIELRPADSTDETLLNLSGVDLRAGETVVFRFQADAGQKLSYDLVATSPPAAVVLVGPAALAITVGTSASEVPIPHGGTHHLVVSADVGTALSVTVTN